MPVCGLHILIVIYFSHCPSICLGIPEQVGRTRFWLSQLTSVYFLKAQWQQLHLVGKEENYRYEWVPNRNQKPFFLPVLAIVVLSLMPSGRPHLKFHKVLFVKNPLARVVILILPTPQLRPFWLYY